MNGGDLIPAEGEAGFFAPVAEAAGAEKEIADVPGAVAIVEERHGGGREVDENAVPGIRLDALLREIFLKGRDDVAASETDGIVREEEEGGESGQRGGSEK